jgi:hypothetical protein
MQQKVPASVLIAPLDWGLGHATRCIPIIKELLRQGARVTIAARGSQKNLLKKEFPLIEFLEIPGYEIRYKPGGFLKWDLIFRIPGFLKQIKRENKWLEKTLENRQIDAVISDSRYGLFHKDLFCVFITHQLYIQSGSPANMDGSRWRVHRLMNRVLMKWNYKFISKFSCCWVPDQAGSLSFAGILSHPPRLPGIPIKYIGILSRFQPYEGNVVKDSLLILLSGPEPARTRFEDILFRQLAASGMQTVVVRGLPAAVLPVPFIREGVSIYNHLSSDELNVLLIESEIIVARSGYSTIMDLIRLKKNALLVPTPGQTEQEYLGYYLQEKKWMYCVSQKKFNLGKAIERFQHGQRILPEPQEDLLKNVVEEFLHHLQTKKKVPGSGL